jgi:RimJ/RimL family protein N-acetyltransferase
VNSEPNDLGQPVGFEVRGWRHAQLPSPDSMVGRYCTVERLHPGRHVTDLFAANATDPSNANWTYLSYGPFPTLESYTEWAAEAARSDDPMFFAVLDGSTGQATGVASLLRVSTEDGSIEVGHINFSPLLQRTRASTEAMYLMMTRVFDDWGYRRYEWKCNSLNAPSMAAAARLGFTYEGTHRQAKVTKGRNRDTAWFSIIDAEWPTIKPRLQSWLDPSNFDETGRQRTALARAVRD